MASSLVDIDLSAIEARILSSLDLAKLTDHRGRLLSHRERAAVEHGVPPSEVTPGMEKLAKDRLYLMMYGGDHAAAELLRQEAEGKFVPERTGKTRKATTPPARVVRIRRDR